MSLILEALRKSEAERRRGAAPSLHAEMPPAVATASPFASRWPLWVGLAVVLPVAAWIAYRLVGTNPVAPTVTTSMPVEAPALAPVRHLDARAAPPATRPDVAATTDKPALAPSVLPDAAPTPASDEPQTAAELAASIAARAAIAERNDRVAVASPPPSAMASPARTLSLSDLSIDERKALPPLKMSMHLWNDDPSQRFVIIDGDRLHEGDRIGSAVVTSIVSDGVLLDWNGRQLKLPIR